MFLLLIIISVVSVFLKHDNIYGINIKLRFEYNFNLFRYILFVYLNLFKLFRDKISHPTLLILNLYILYLPLNEITNFCKFHFLTSFGKFFFSISKAVWRTVRVPSCSPPSDHFSLHFLYLLLFHSPFGR